MQIAARQRINIYQYIRILVIAGLIGAAIVTYTSGRLYVNTGISSDKTLFWRTGGPIHQGDYVTFLLDHPLLPHPTQVVKQVRCEPGQHLRVDDKAAWCDDVFLGPKKKKTLKGEDMPVFNYDGIIPEGKYFVMNKHKDSFDSRYYGLRDGKELTKLKVLF